MDNTETADIVRQHYPLDGAVAPLVELIRVNPWLTEEIVRLALVMGIHAAYKRIQSQPDMDRLVAMRDIIDSFTKRF